VIYSPPAHCLLLTADYYNAPVNPIPQWQGLRREWQLLREGWRALPDNPLWLLAQRMHLHSAPRIAKRRRGNLVLGGLIVGGLYSLSIAAVLGTSGQFETEAVLGITMGFIVALAVLVLLSCVLNLSTRACLPRATSSWPPCASCCRQRCWPRASRAWPASRRW
jgi:hypothetical protein